MASRRFGNLVFHPEDGRLRNERADLDVSLRPQAANLLEFLLDHAGEVVPRERLFKAVWGEEAVVDFESGLAALMRELRQAIRSVDGPEDAIETVPRRGYRLNVELRREGGTGRRIRRLLFVCAAVLAVLVAIGFSVRWPHDAPPPEQPIEFSLAILPFEDYERTAQLPEHAGLLMADTLLAELLLRPAEGLQLLGRTSLRPYLDRSDVVSAVAADLGVDVLIEGAVIGMGEGGWRAESRLLAVPTGRVVWSTSIEGGADQALDVRAVASEMASDLVRSWAEIRRQLIDRAAND